ncbi:DNA methyltransferase (plasmid) [Lactiplantibacillus plantarum]|uniref:DNA methyltransferase n=1 Tax=Lactiplantibacillus plantarum TaxID=1590 RepID=UPI00338DF1B4
MPTRKQAAQAFVKTWSDSSKGREDADRQSFWNDLLQRVYGITNYYNYIEYEKDVQVQADGKITTRRIDGYIPSTKVMIEMKGKNVNDLSKPIKQSGGDELTPYEQAKRYANHLPNSEQPRWIIVSNFSEFDIHDMEDPLGDPEIIRLEDLPQKVKVLEFLVNVDQQKIINEKKLSVDAGNLVAKVYDELTKAYAAGRGVDIDDPKIQQSLNMLIVRLVFLMYADDSNLFARDNFFQNFIERREPQDIRRGLIELFKVLDQPEEERDPYLSDEFNQFAYVNGGMFSNENIVIPQFTDELKRLIVEDAGAGFDWSDISPTIFGAVFESTLNPETRRSGGMHYTSIENIHKVIDPLFLNDLHEEFDKIQNMGNSNQRTNRAREFRQKLGKLAFFDPACGSGNFLTETYLSLRKMENECLRIIVGENPTLVTSTEYNPLVKIQNFYGIEINDFAVAVARTAMWIAESQMWEQTKDITYANQNFLPLDSNDSIYEGNALQMKWDDIIKPYELNYIMGNPPFVGYKYQNKSQKEDIKHNYRDENNKPFKSTKKIDYVACWFFKAAEFIKGSTTKVSFVSTNSITQGDLVYNIWAPLIKLFSVNILFAYRTFIWNNEAKNKANVHVVIIGFNSGVSSDSKIIYDPNPKMVKHINPYLLDAPTVMVRSQTDPISATKSMNIGCLASDGGNLIIDESEIEDFKKNDPLSVKYIKRVMGGVDLLRNGVRYCLWLQNVKPGELKKMPMVINRLKRVKEHRLKSSKDQTREMANVPYLFQEIRLPGNDYLAIPATSSERRDYIPMKLLSKDVIPLFPLSTIPNSTLYDLGILESSTHMAWMRIVAGRMKSDYRYSSKVVYNTFPWPNINVKQKFEIKRTAQGILDARNNYPESSLADLYDPLEMPIDLRKAHQSNDRAVLKAYGLKPTTTEAEVVHQLFKMYEKLTKQEN